MIRLVLIWAMSLIVLVILWVLAFGSIDFSDETVDIWADEGSSE